MRMEMEQSQPNSLTGGPFSGPTPTYSAEQGLRRSMFGGHYVG